MACWASQKLKGMEETGKKDHQNAPTVVQPWVWPDQTAEHDVVCEIRAFEHGWPGHVIGSVCFLNWEYAEFAVTCSRPGIVLLGKLHRVHVHYQILIGLYWADGKNGRTERSTRLNSHQVLFKAAVLWFQVLRSHQPFSSDPSNPLWKDGMSLHSM